MIKKQIVTLEPDDNTHPKQSRVFFYKLYNRSSELMAKYLGFPFMFIIWIIVLPLAGISIKNSLIISTIIGIITHLILWKVSPYLYTTNFGFDEGMSSL